MTGAQKASIILIALVAIAALIFVVFDTSIKRAFVTQPEKPCNADAATMAHCLATLRENRRLQAELDELNRSIDDMNKRR